MKVRFLKKSGILAEEFTNILKNRYNDGLKYIFIENYIHKAHTHTTQNYTSRMSTV